MLLMMHIAPNLRIHAIGINNLFVAFDLAAANFCVDFPVVNFT